jgi:cytochrome c-type biogenesis protein CcmH
MIWPLVALLVLAAFAFAVLAFRAPRAGWEAIGAALLLGVAGYAMQGHPDLQSVLKAPAEGGGIDGENVVAARIALSTSSIPTQNRWVILADALARRGRFAEAVEVLDTAVGANPGDYEAWLAMGNALVAHAAGAPTPAALHAYRRSIESAPHLPGPRFFYGVSLIQLGRAEDARAQWQAALDAAPEDAAYRPLIAASLLRLDRASGASPLGTPASDAER